MHTVQLTKHISLGWHTCMLKLAEHILGYGPRTGSDMSFG